MASLLFSFRGRINRAKYWLVVLGILIAELMLFLALLGGDATPLADPQELSVAIGPFGGIVLLVFLVVITWISVAVAAKRFHDRDKTGWWVLIVLVPVIGPLWYLIEVGFLRGTDGHNSYGSDPLARY